jgi:histidinol-phosphate aminotransferase
MNEPNQASPDATTPESRTGCRIAARMLGVRAYQPPPPDPRIDLHLDANEGPALEEETIRALQRITPEMLRRYPTAAPLERDIAERLGIDPRRVVVTNGGDDAIDRLCRAVLEPARTLVQHTPTFTMIEHAARLAGATTIDVPWADGPFPAEDFIEAITPATGLVALVSPNNPTGLAIDTRALLRVVDAAAGGGGAGAAALIDLAYIEFADVDPTPELLDRPSAVMVRTFSKAFGLAGLRVGYAIAPAPIADLLRAAGGPYPVSSVSLALAAAALQRSEERRDAIERIRLERAALIDQILKIGTAAPSSQANFVLLRGVDAARVHTHLLERGISVRVFASNPALHDALRITLPGEPLAFERLLDALRDIPTTTGTPDGTPAITARSMEPIP